MKHIKTVAMSLLLANSFSSNEVTWKEIEAEIKPHIEEVESDFSALTKSISEVYKQYREATSTATEFDDFGDYFTEKEKEGKKVRDESELEKIRENNKKIAQDKKNKKEEAKKEEKEITKKIITEIKKNITDILNADKDITINEEKITSNKDILKGIDNILNIIKKTHSTITNFNNLKTFSEIDEFTKNYKRITGFFEKNKNNIEIFFYTLIFNAMKEKKGEILELFDFPKNIITGIKEKEKIELKETPATKVAHAVYNYIKNLETILNTDRTKIDNFIAKNKITSEYLSKEKNKLKEENKEEKYSKKVFKNKSLNNMTIFEALSSEKNKEIVRTESPTILAILEKFKGTEEENKKMTVRRAINIIIDFTELSFLEKKEIDTDKIRNEKKKKQEANFDSKRNERLEKLEQEIKKLEKEEKTLKEKIEKQDPQIKEKSEKINSLFTELEKDTKEGPELKSNLENIYFHTNKTEKMIFSEAENLISFIKNSNTKEIATKIYEIYEEIFPKIKDIFRIEKKIKELRKQIEKINSKTYKEQTYIDEATGNEEKSRAELAEKKIAARGQTKKETAEEKSNEKQQQATKGKWETTKKVERGASIKKNESRTALKKAKQKGKAAVKAAAKEELFNRDNAKEESKTDMLISKEELAKDKKQKSKEAPF